MLKKYDLIMLKLEKIVEKFNLSTKLNIKLVVKGSYILSYKNLINRPINDLDFTFTSENSLEDKQKFFTFLAQQLKINYQINDYNLYVFWLENVKIEFTTLDSFENQYCFSLSNFQNILFLKKYYAVIQKISSYCYILSHKYIKDDREVKVLNTNSDLQEILAKIDFLKIIEEKKEKITYFFHRHNINSFYIYVHYKYENWLFLDKNSYFFQKYMPQNVYQIIQKLYSLPGIELGIKKMDFLLENYNFFAQNLIEKYDEISLSGLEEKFLQKFSFIKEKNLWKKIGSQNKILLIGHADEVGGLIINAKVYNVGTIFWKSEFYNIFDLDNNFLAKTQGKPAENIIFSHEKNQKINRPRLEIDLSLPKDKIYQIIPHKNFEILKSFFAVSRNFDNKINVFNLDFFVSTNQKFDCLITTKEEIGLKGIKNFKNDIFFAKYKLIVNLEVSENENYSQNKVLVRVADFFNSINKKVIFFVQKIFEKYAIPYEFFYGSGSTDATELSNFNVLTLAIPADKIHSTSSKINLQNLFMLQYFLLLLQEENLDEF